MLGGAGAGGLWPGSWATVAAPGWGDSCCEDQRHWAASTVSCTEWGPEQPPREQGSDTPLLLHGAGWGVRLQEGLAGTPPAGIASGDRSLAITVRRPARQTEGTIPERPRIRG